MYLTQNEYVRNGGKKDMDKDMYNRYAFTACRTVDFYTSGRIYKDIAYYNGVENLPYERDLCAAHKPVKHSRKHCHAGGNRRDFRMGGKTG